METEDFEVKSDFNGSDRQWLRLIKTIVSMANTADGKVALESLAGDAPETLDPARVDDAVHKYVDPRIDNLRVDLNTLVNGQTFVAVVTIPDSEHKPHMITREGQYVDTEGRHHREFYRGQVWVRHSASNAPANEDDIDRIFRSRLGLLLGQLRTAVLQQPLGTWEESGRGMPIYPTDDPTAPHVALLYPCTARSLGALTSRSQSWIARTADVLGWRTDGKPKVRYMQAIPSADGDYVQQWRYSEEAKSELERLTIENPKFNPYSTDLSED